MDGAPGIQIACRGKERRRKKKGSPLNPVFHLLDTHTEFPPLCGRKGTSKPFPLYIPCIFLLSPFSVPFPIYRKTFSRIYPKENERKRGKKQGLRLLKELLGKRCSRVIFNEERQVMKSLIPRKKQKY